MMYKIVQTGPKSQLGGLNDGLTKEGNQLLTELEVNNDPDTPTTQTRMIEVISFHQLFIFIKGGGDI